MRGDIHQLRATRAARGHEQRGAQYAVIVQSDDLLSSTVLVAPTSRSAQHRIFRPTNSVRDQSTQVLVAQTAAVAAERLGDLVGRASLNDLQRIDAALRVVLGLD